MCSNGLGGASSHVEPIDQALMIIMIRQVLKWNTPARDFYLKRLGAEAMEEWEGMRLDVAGIKRLQTLIS